MFGKRQILHSVFFHNRKNQLVDIRPIWFHYVVGKTIGIVSIMVMNPKCWQESAAHNGPSNDSP